MGEIADYFETMTKTELTAKIHTFQQKAYFLQQQILDLEAQYEKENADDIRIRAEIQEKHKAFLNGRDFYTLTNKEKAEYWKLGNTSSYTKRLNEARKELHINYVYNEGYHLLNDIGAFFRGQSWNYRLTLTDKAQGTYSFIMDSDEFIEENTRFTLEGLVLKDASSIINKYKDIMNQERLIELHAWNDTDSLYNLQQLQNYATSTEYGKRILIRGNSGGNLDIPLTKQEFGYSHGNIIEGYMALLDHQNKNTEHLIALMEKVANIANSGKSVHLGSSFVELEGLYMQLQRQTNSAGFWTGPDTKYQEKTNKASVYDFSTIRNQLNKVVLLFSNLNFVPLEQKAKDAESWAVEQISATYRNIIQKLASAFNATGFSEVDTMSLNSEIQALLSTN